MALQWADIPSGQIGLYGTTLLRMLDGTPWVALGNTGVTALIPDPDTLTFPDGKVLRPSTIGASGPSSGPRLVLNNPNQKAGVAFRVWFPALPGGSSTPLCFFTSTGNANRYGVGVRANGGLEIATCSTTIGTYTPIATADFPIILANSWNHVEFVSDVVTGESEIRVNGVSVLSHTDGAPFGGTIGHVVFGDEQPGGVADTERYLKDIVLYNGAGAQLNDFQGTVIVTDLIPQSDDTIGGWIASTGTTAWDLLDEAPPNDSDYIYSTVPPTAPAVVNLTDLSEDIVSVRGLVMVSRGFNSDSGDGNVQMGVSSDGGANIDTGISHPLTTTARYVYDTSELSATTGLPWTPLEIDALTLQLDRTT